MVNQLQTVSEVELMAMIGGSDYKGTCFFDCLLSVMESKGLQGSRNDMLISYGKTYIEIDNPCKYKLAHLPRRCKKTTFYRIRNRLNFLQT